MNASIQHALYALCVWQALSQAVRRIRGAVEYSRADLGMGELDLI